MTQRLETMGGEHIRDVLRQAVADAHETEDEVVFDFNGTEHRVYPSDTYEEAKARAEGLLGHPILTCEQEAEEVRRSLEETQAKWAAAIAAAGVPTEAEMRAAVVPTPETPEALAEYIAALAERPHDYGTCVYAMSMAAVAAFNFVAHKLGVTGFQASCADMDILRRTRGLKHGVRLVDMSGVLYPQYWTGETRGMFEAALRERPEYWAEQAAELLSADSGVDSVRNHWRWILATASMMASKD